jgi:hypothetical protein
MSCSTPDKKREECAFIKNEKAYKFTQQLYTDYGSAPSWWTRLFSNRPKKREAALLIKKAILNPQEADALVFPLAGKPFECYW